ncbi:hypothetical protein [Candidatus Accumulibacter vicinus]|uniref:Uncharacterized protein n=1 Tax=Candidatus Accumulibacter vicinus TaxID=2954382 RepID=A0A084XXF5_9PROT|nr:hypothetical protein [Candidatus Accumulibacter vicinus]KFB67149.1 MAG: hypothetical protein CAPSK01_003512 [Candidatus Accumulibacter vicinus]
MATFAGTSADDFIIPTANGVDYRGGQGNDTYIISALIPASAVITLTDTEGANKVQLADGLTIASSNFLANAVELTLSNGAKIQITGASTFTYDIGANATAGDAAVTPNQTYAAFAAALGAPAIPGSGTPNYVVPPNLPPVPTFSVTGAAAAAEGTDASFVVSLANRVAGVTYGTTVTLAQTGGATAGTDFANALTLDAASIAAGITLVGNVLTIPATSTVTSVTLKTAVTSDALSPETGEGLSVTLSAPTGTGAVIGAASTVTTAITDVPLSYTISANAASVFENAEVIYTVTASAPVAADTVVAFSVVPGDASAANQGTNNTNLNDFAAGSFNPSNVTIKAGTTTATYSVTAAADIITELPEAFSVKAVVAGVATPLTQATTLLDSAGTGGQTFTLTIGENSGPAFTGGSGNDIFNALIVQNSKGDTVNSLESFDALDGSTGTDTLNATIIGATPAPVLKNIENVNLRFAEAKGIDLTSATGVTTVTVANSTTKSGTISKIGSVANLAVNNQLLSVDFDASTATTLALGLDGAGNPDVNTPTQIVVDLGVATASKVTTLNVTANNANVEITDSTAAEKITTLSVAATGTNILKLTEAAKATAVTVTGAGSVDLTGAAGAAFTGALKTFNSSANTGGVKVDVQSTVISDITTGDGADTISNTVVVAGSSISSGKGNDIIRTADQLTNLSKGINGGDGTDIINISDGSKLDATTAKYISNIETLDVSGGTGNYDVSLNSFATVQIDEAIAGALAGAVDFKNAPDTFTLTIASKAKTNADFAVGKAITVTGKDYAGTTVKGNAETFTLVANLNDGNKDNGADGNIDANTVTVAGVETLVVQATTTTLDGGTDALKASKSTLTAKFVATEAETITIKGDASVDLSSVTTIGVVTKVDASGSTGNVTIDFTGHAKSVAYNGSDGIDTYKAGKAGDTIYTGKGADVVTLDAKAGAAGAVRDVYVLKAATDSQITDTSKDGKITIAADTGFDAVTNFDSVGDPTPVANTSDRLDLTNFGFTGSQRGVVDVSGSVAGTTDLTSVANLFSTVAGNRGVAYTNLGGADSYVLIDVNKDGNFTAAADLIIKLVAVAAVSETLINF